MFLKVLWVLIIPKWLIKVPGHIAILFEWFLELPSFVDPYPQYLSSKYFNKYKKNHGSITETYYLFISQLSGTANIFKVWTHWAQHILVFRVSYFGHHPKQIGISDCFEEDFPKYVLGNLKRPIILIKCKVISESQWIKNMFQRVTYHLSKNLSPRTFLVFMENHGFANFSPHTFLLLCQHHAMARKD